MYRHKRNFYGLCILLLLIALVVLSLYLSGVFTQKNTQPIKVGVLFSQTGTMSTNEIPVIHTILMGIDAINRKGGG